MSGILSGFLLFSSIIGVNYSLYKLGMWSVRKRLIDTRELLLLQHPQDDVLISDISNHIKELELLSAFKVKKKNLCIDINDERFPIISKDD